MADIKIAYGTKTAIGVTLNGLGNGSARESDVVDNTSNLYHDYLVRCKGAATTSGSNYVDVFVYGSASDGTYTDGATGSDAAFTASNRLNSPRATSLKMNTITNVIGAFSVAQAFNGVIPPKWGLIFVNNSGSALSTSAWSVDQQGVYFTSA